MFQGLTAQRLLALFALGWLLLSFPLLSLWDRDVSLFGMPLLPVALFIGWAVLIGALAWIAERSPVDDAPKARAAPPPEGNPVGLGRPGAD